MVFLSEVVEALKRAKSRALARVPRSASRKGFLAARVYRAAIHSLYTSAIQAPTDVACGVATTRSCPRTVPSDVIC